MRPLFRKDPWCSTPGRTLECGIVDLTLIAAVIALIVVLSGVDSSEIDEVIKWFKTLNDIFLTDL